MTLRKRIIDLHDVQQQTALHREWIVAQGRKLKDALEDPRKSERTKVHECQYCYYIISWICGQGFTDWVCSNCGKEDTWANTCTPYLCHECAGKLGLCVMCTADVNLKTRRKLDKGEPS